MCVIITNGKNRIAYNIARSLGKRGIMVHSADFVPFSMTFASKYSKSHFLYPSPFRYPREFIECIIQNINRLKAKILIPVFEETFLIAKHKYEILNYTKMVIPDYDQILTAHNKDRWVPIANDLKIPVPRNWTINELKKMNNIVHLPFPLLIKPKQGGGAWAITEIDSGEELNKVLIQDKYLDFSWERFFVQEKIHGEAHCVAMLFREGEYRAKVTYKQLRDYPAKGGQATLRIGIHNEQAEEYFERMLKTLKWHGICQADFIVDRKTDIPYLIDINPRFWGSLVQGIASGVDFPYLLYQIGVEGDVESVKEFKSGVITRWIGGDLIGSIQYFKQTREKVKFLRDFFLSFKKSSCYDDFDLKDPLPFFIWGLEIVARVIKQKTFNPRLADHLEGIWE